MPSANPDATLDLNGHLQIRPREVETPLARSMESMLGYWLWQAEAAKNIREGHASCDTLKKGPHAGRWFFLSESYNGKRPAKDQACGN